MTITEREGPVARGGEGLDELGHGRMAGIVLPHALRQRASAVLERLQVAVQGACLTEHVGHDWSLGSIPIGMYVGSGRAAPDVQA